MDRRAFLSLLAVGTVALPPAARAQPAGKVPLVGVMNSGAGPRSTTIDITRQGLRDLGYIDGQTIAFDVRFAGLKQDAFPGLAADLVRQKVNVLLVSGPAAIRAAKHATSAIPIVALDLESDPVQAGFVRSLAQPGGNITGCFLDQPGLTGKWLELIGEAVPGARRIAVLADMTTGPWQLAAIKAAAEKLRIELQVLEIRRSEELDHALGAGLKSGSRALVQLSSPIFDAALASRIADFSLNNRLPGISMFSRFTEAGGLMSYGPNQLEYYKRLAIFIDKILKGAKPGDLPVEQPTKFDFIINLKTAKAIGLALQQSLVSRADQVIQ
jgi:putative tryptophan/tyrosine transport system substrate-binding protein